MSAKNPKAKKQKVVGVEFNVERLYTNLNAYKPIGNFNQSRHNKHYWRYFIKLEIFYTDRTLRQMDYYDRTTEKVTMSQLGTTIRKAIDELCGETWHVCVVKAYVVPDEVAKREIPAYLANKAIRELAVIEGRSTHNIVEATEDETVLIDAILPT